MLFILLVHVFFAGVPVLLDLVLGKPNYGGRFPGFTLATQDELTSVIYCAYVSIVPLVLWRVGRRRKRHVAPVRHEVQPRSVRRVRPLLYAVLISPALALLFAPSPSIYLHYAQIARDSLYDYDASSYHPVISLLSILSVLGAAGILLTARGRLSRALLATLPFLSISIWLNGKRFIVALAVVLLGYVIWHRGHLRGGRTVLVGLVVAAAISVSSIAYQAAFRGVDLANSGWDTIYTGLRIDFGRDDVIKLAIYSELHPEQGSILEHRGQSVLFYLTMFVPRDVWPEKPLPYAQYMTSALMLTSPRLWGWGMTTSWLDEAIANFGWFGLLAGPLLIALVCRAGDNSSIGVVRLLTVVTASLLLAVQLVAFAPVALLWVAAVIFVRRRRRVSHPSRRRDLDPEGTVLAAGR